MPAPAPFTRFGCLLLLWGSLGLGSCYSYRVATHAQPATGGLKTNSKKAYSLFWGVINKPQVITTAACDNMGSTGLAEVNVRTSFGNALLTVVTLGIYCPVRIEWKCGKPCPQTGQL